MELYLCPHGAKDSRRVVVLQTALGVQCACAWGCVPARSKSYPDPDIARIPEKLSEPCKKLRMQIDVLTMFWNTTTSLLVVSPRPCSVCLRIILQSNHLFLHSDWCDKLED